MSNKPNVPPLTAQEQAWAKAGLTELAAHHGLDSQTYLVRLLDREATRELPNWRWRRLGLTNERVIDAADDLTVEGGGFTLSELLDYMGVGSENLKTRARKPLGQILEANSFRYKAYRIQGRQRWLWGRK
tara:strand:+ start:401 stop:790 length:390 start_codon:yes stop_codon:yes gene_type:complete